VIERVAAGEPSILIGSSLGGYLAGTAQARRAAEEPLTRRLWHRLPWLLIGFRLFSLTLGRSASASACA